MKTRTDMFNKVLTALLSGIILMLSLIPNIGFIMIAPGVTVTIIHIPVLIGVFLVGRKESLILGLMFGLGSLFQALLRASTPFDQAFIYPWISVIPRMLFAYFASIFISLFKKVTTFKNGKTYLFILVSIITALGLYFGLTAFINTFNNETLNNVFLYLTPIIILLFIGFYIYLIYFKYSNKSYIPAVMIISTFIHTILVLSFVYLFSPKAFTDTFGTNNTVMGIIFLIAITNGLLEAIVGSLIATPVVIASLVKMEGE